MKHVEFVSDAVVKQGGTLFDPNIYEVLPDGPWLTSVKMRAREASLYEVGNLFLCVSKLTGVVFVGLWVLRPGNCLGPRGIMEQIEGLPEGMLHRAMEGGLPTIEFMMQRLKPFEEHKDEMARRLKEERLETVRAKEESRSQAEDMAEHMSRKGDVMTANALRRGIIPYVGEREAGGLNDPERLLGAI